MICELNKDEFERCSHLEYLTVESQAVIQGTNPGRIFVDHRLKPTTALIWHHSLDLGFKLVGKPDNVAFNDSLNGFIDGSLKSEARIRGQEYFEVASKNHIWNKSLDQIFAFREFMLDTNRIYKVTRDNFDLNKNPSIRDSYKLQRITKEFIQTYTLDNADFLKFKIQDFWKSFDDFFEKGIGYGVLHENKLVSLCFSAFVSQGTHAVDIETLKEYQGEKLASKVAFAFSKECVDRGLTAHWDVMEVNSPSLSVAEKLGYKHESSYNVYYFPFEK